MTSQDHTFHILDPRAYLLPLTLTPSLPLCLGPRVMPLVHEKLVPDPRPEPGAGRPFLASARLTVPVLAPKLGKGMVNKMKQLHADLNLPARPLPTQVRHDDGQQEKDEQS